MIDAVDRQIIELLEVDARRSNREISRQISMSEATVRTRLRKLRDTGAIRYTVLVDPVSEGLNRRAYVRLVVSLGQVDAVMQYLVSRQETAFVASTLGRYNILAFVLTTDDAALRKLVSDDIAALPGVRELDVRVSAGALKYDSRTVRVMGPPARTQKETNE